MRDLTLVMAHYMNLGILAEQQKVWMAYSAKLRAKLLHQAIAAAYDEEPGNTEWHLVNALTRVATHSADVSPNRQRLLQNIAGEFTRDFSLVDARLPNSVALRVGARILRNANELIEV